MYPRATFRYLAPLLAMASLSTLTACGSGSSTTDPPPPPAQSPVNHIIFLSEENRSFDHYFGKLNDYRSAAPFNLPREVNGLPDDCSSFELRLDCCLQCHEHVAECEWSAHHSDLCLPVEDFLYRRP